ncbi:MAG: zinc ribbon domain-containing protein [Oceanidesulfovibrio sp.]
MSIYLKQIEQLVALQRVDSEIIGLRQELESAPKEVDELEANYSQYRERKEQILEKIDYLQSQQKRLDSEISDDDLKIKKSKNKLMMASNTKEYHAMMREMDNIEKLNRMREEERMALVEELERQRSALEEVESESSSLKENLDEKQSTLEQRVEQIEARLTELEKQRKAAGQHVPGPVLGRYEFIRSRLAAPVIVPVVEGVCTGCNIAIPPQGFIELQKGQQILNCPNCQRLIYWCEHFEDSHEPIPGKPQVAAKIQTEAAEEAE